MTRTSDREEVLARVDLAELLAVIASDRGLAPRGRQFPCPSVLHDQTGASPPVSVGMDARGYGIWSCHSCDASGTAIDALVLSGRAQTVADAFEQLGATTMIARTEPENVPAAIPDRVLDRLAVVKGWTASTLRRLGVGWDGQRLLIPVHDAEGRRAGTVRYLPNAEAKGERKTLVAKGTARLLFPPPERLPPGEVWIVEGEPDAISGHEIGLSAVGVPGVDSWKPGWAARFKRFERAVIVPDCDDPGRELAKRVAYDLIDVGVGDVRILPLDGGEKYDLGDMVRECRDDLPACGEWVRNAAAALKPIPHDQAALERAALQAQAVGLPLSLRDGADVLAATETYVPAVWGEHPLVLWAKGEPFMLAAATGAGKTTLAQQLILRRLGKVQGPLLGLNVEISSRPVLYLAIDREQQAARSMRRMAESTPRGKLLWHSDFGTYKPIRHPPRQLVEWLGVHDVGTLVVDSLYGLLAAKDERALDWYGQLLRELAAAEVEVMLLHHFRKRGKDDGGSSLIDRVYGGMQVTAAVGSVLALAGEPGDTEVEAYHVKQPGPEVCGPWTLSHNHERGVTSAARHMTIVEYLEVIGPGTVDEIAEGCHADSRKAGRILKSLMTSNKVRLAGDGTYQLADDKFANERYAKF